MLYLLVVVTLQVLVSSPRWQRVNQWNGLVVVVKKLLSQRRSQQQDRRQDSQKHRKEKVWFGMSVVAGPSNRLLVVDGVIAPDFVSNTHGSLRLLFYE